MRLALALLLLLAIVLIPFLLFERDATALALSLAEGGRERPMLLASLLVALLASDVILPIPSSILSVLAGASLGLAGGAAAIWLGMMAGCLVGYFVGRNAGRMVMLRIVSEADIANAWRAMRDAGAPALIVTRAVPVLAESLVLGAGAIGFPFRRFLIATGLANIAPALAYAAVGALAFETGSFILLFAGLTALPLIGWLIWIWIRR